jgi:predicted dithiol-disulfide oxidoreductase (DUF899 family)
MNSITTTWMEVNMESHRIVSREQWITARTALLAKEKEFTRALVWRSVP